MSPHIVFCDPKESVWKLHCSLWKKKSHQNVFLTQKIRTVLRAAGLLSGRPLPRVCRGVHLVQKKFSLFTFCSGYQKETSKYSCLPQERYIPATKLFLPAQKVMEATIHSFQDTNPNDLLIIQAGTKSAWLHQTTGRGRSNKGTVCLYPAFTRPHVEHSVPFWDSQQGDNNGEPQWWWGDWRGLILAWRREV